jgi:hypothetical protein
VIEAAKQKEKVLRGSEEQKERVAKSEADRQKLRNFFQLLSEKSLLLQSNKHSEVIN